MVFDRYYQFGAVVLAIVLLREDLLFVLLFLMPIFMAALFVLLPVFVFLMVRQEFCQRFGAKQERGLLKLRWELSRSGMLSERRRAKAAKAILGAYDLIPGPALAEQTAQLGALMKTAYDIDRKVPPLLQQSLTPESLGKALAEAANLTGAPRTALISALRRAAPKERPNGLLRGARVRLRKALGPFVASNVQRKRIALVFSQVIVGGAARKNERLLALFETIRRAREKNGLGVTPDNMFDPLEGLPLGVQRRMVLFSEAAFGIANMRRAALSDPGQIKWLRRVREQLDGIAAPDRHLWDPEVKTPAAKPTAPQTMSSEMSEAELRQAVERESQDAIYLKRSWPCGTDVPGRSWFGGTPLLPSTMAWPRIPRTGQPLHFLAQIDCADLPHTSDKIDMPKDGLLLFFAAISEEMDWEDEEGSAQVLYVPASTIPEQITDLPKSLPAFGARLGKPDEGHSGAGDRSYPRWPLTAHPIKSYHGDFSMPRAALEIAGMAQSVAVQALLPQPSTARRAKVIVSDAARDPETGKAMLTDENHLIYRHAVSPELMAAGFPFCGAVVSGFFSRLEGMLVADFADAHRIKAIWERELEELDGDEAARKRSHLAKTVKKIEAMTEKLALLQQAAQDVAALGRYDVPSEAEAMIFCSWLIKLKEQHVGRTEDVVRQAVKLVTQQAVTDTRMRAVLPHMLFDVFDLELRPSAEQSHHMMLGHTQFRTNSTAGPGVRLLALDSDYGLDFMFCDAGMAEFWIRPEDLARRDFTKAVALTAGG